jgi:DNA repair exonuclease SbcCD ATPase subunit
VPLAGQGVVFIEGKNKDTGSSNGAGKSAIWTVFEHVHFENTSRKLKKTEILPVTPVDDGYLGELKFEKDGQVYLARQSRGHSRHGTGLKIYKQVSDDWVNITPKSTGRGEPKELLQQIIGFTSEEFHGCVLLSEGGTHVLIEGTPNERQIYLSALFGLDRHDLVIDKVNDHNKEIGRKLVELVTIEGRYLQVQEQLKQYESYEAIIHKYESNKVARDFAEKSLQEVKDSLKLLRSKITSAGRQADIETRLALLCYKDYETTRVSWEITSDKEISLLKEKELYQQIELKLKTKQDLEIERAKVVTYHDVDLTKTKSTKEEVDRRIVTLESDLPKLAQKKALKEKIKALSIEFESLESEEELTTKYRQTVEQLALVKSSIQQHEKQQAKYKKFGSQCPECEQPLDPIIVRAKLDKVTETLTEENKIKASLEQQVIALKKRLEATIAVVRYSDQLSTLPTGDLKTTNNELEEVNTTREVLRKQILGKEEYDRLSASVAKIELPGVYTLESVKELVSISNTDLAIIRKDLTRLAEGKSLFEQLQDIKKIDLTTTKIEIISAEEAETSLVTALRKIEQDFATAKVQKEAIDRLLKQQNEMKEQVDEIEGLRKEQRIYGALLKALPKLKKKQLHVIVMSMVNVLPRYINDLFDETVVIKSDESEEDSLDLMLERYTQDRIPVRIPIKAASKGEKQRLSIAFLFALNAIQRPEKKSNLLVLDEVDSGLDASGVTALGKLIENVKGKFETVIMISHREQLDATVFDKRWTVVKEKGISQLLLNS